jgi:hypothetical protein
MLDPKSPDYKNTELRVDANFASLYINFKAETVIYLLNFIKPEEEPLKYKS